MTTTEPPQPPPPKADDATDAGFGFKRSQPPQQQPLWPKPLPASALEDATLEYRFDHGSRGHCLVFNQVSFSRATGQPDRDGSDVDAAALEVTFRRLAFSVRCFRNLRAAELTEVLREYRAKSHADCDCLAVVLLSHGYDGHFYAHDRQLSIDWVAKQFRPDACPSLAGKPKLFFIQACRGDNFDPGVEVADSGDADNDDLDAIGGGGAGGGVPVRLMRVPMESDFYFFYSTPPGYFSWRNSQRGSWFVQQLTAVLDRHGDQLELQHLMLLVQRLVASAFASDTGEVASTGMKQMPVAVSQLRKLLYFRPKK